MSRSHRQRRKGTSLAVGAAMLAAPVVPAFAGSRGASPRGGRGLDTSSVGAATGGKTQLLRFGDVGPAVAAIQAQVGVATDGIFGPITRGAVERFQRAHGLAMSGVVDARTWAALFHARVLFYDDSGSSARPAHAEQASVRLVVDRRRDDDGGDDGGQRSTPAPATSAPAPAPSGSAPSRSPAPSSTPGPSSTPAPSAPAAGGCTDGRIVAPVSGATLTGRFGESRPGHTHAGDDLAIAAGTPIHAAQCGTVVQSGTEQGYGLMVCIRHAGGVTSCYAHMSRAAATVSQQVQAGQVIGYVGCTGSCTGPHVHFEVRRDGMAEDPAPYLAGTKTIAGATSTASSASATKASTSRTTMSAGRSSGTVTHAAVTVANAAAPAPKVAVTAAAATAPATAEAPKATTPASAPAPTPAAEQPAPAPTAEQPAPAPAPAPAAEQPAPAPAPAPAAEQPAPAPAPTAEQPAPAAEQPAPTPTPAAEQPAPAAEQPAPAPQPAASNPA